MTASDILTFVGGVGAGHGVRTGLGVTGVAIGVAAVVLLVSVGEGARAFVASEFSSLGTNLLIVVPGNSETLGAGFVASSAQQDLTLDDVAAIESLRTVGSVAPLSLGAGAASYDRGSMDVNIVGTNAAWLDTLGGRPQVGRFLSPEMIDQRVCVIGPTVQRSLFADQNPLGQLLRLNEDLCRVIGVMAPRGAAAGVDLDAAVYVPTGFSQRMFGSPGLYRIFARATNRASLDAANEQILTVIEEQHRDRRDVTVFTQDALLASFGRVVSALTLMLAAIAAVSLLVAGIGIMNIMLVSVSERASEIGLMKALGATNFQILALFLSEAVALSMTGGMVGLGLAYATAGIFGRLYPAYAVWPPLWTVGASLFVAITVGMVFGVVPALQAARRDPVAALTGRAV